MKALLIINVKDLKANPFSVSGSRVGIPMRHVSEAGIVIIKTETHFRCIKNRWITPVNDEKIPLSLLKDYISKHREQLVEAYISQMEAIIRAQDPNEIVSEMIMAGTG